MNCLEPNCPFLVYKKSLCSAHFALQQKRERLEQTRERKRLYEQERRCVQCGKPKEDNPENTTKKCNICRDGERAGYLARADEFQQKAKEKRESRKALGLCERGDGQPIAIERSKRFCIECLEKNIVKEAANKAIKISQGLCIYGACKNPLTIGQRCQKHAEENSARLNNYYSKLKTMGICQDCKEAPITSSSGPRCRFCKEVRRSTASDKNKKLKSEMLAVYGTSCVCCKERIPEFLTLDHIDNDGFTEEHSGFMLYKKLKNAGWPGVNTRYQTLCWNCQFSKLINEGMGCIHSVKRKDTIENLCKKNEKFARKIRIIKECGGSCYCCGEAEIDFMSLDHTNNDGAEHRKEIKTNIYSWLENNKNDGIVATACMNCNSGRNLTIDKVCPHKRRKENV